MTLKDCESFGEGLAERQRDVMFQIADLQRYAESHWPGTFHQIWPVWMSPAIPDRTKAISRAYPKEKDRQIEATYTQYNQNASKPDRMKRLQAIVDAGLTSDESRDKDKKERNQEQNTYNRPRRLIVFDMSYFICRNYHSGAGVETAMQVSEWVQGTVDRLKQEEVTDAACAFEGIGSFRKELTAGEGWEKDRYKGRRGPKDTELVQQIHLTRELLESLGFLCVSVDKHEADDVMASYAAQFQGKTTIASADKDLKQSLSDQCDILLGVDWVEDATYGNMLPEYHWYTAKMLMEETGLTPAQHIEFQILAGDSVDSISGVHGIGVIWAQKLITEFGTAEAVIAAAKDDDERIKQSKRKALLDFESKLDVTRQLVTMKTDLALPNNTRI